MDFHQDSGELLLQADAKAAKLVVMIAATNLMFSMSNSSDFTLSKLSHVDNSVCHPM